jgi:excisionase family DNA binding protein
MAVVMNRARLLGVMTEKRWGQTDLARSANIPQSTVSRLLSGAMEPSGPTIAKLMDCTGLRYEELFTNDVVMADRYLRTAEVAKRLGTSTKFVTRLVWRGELHAIRLGRSARAPMRFAEAEVTRYLSTRQDAAS